MDGNKYDIVDMADEACEGIISVGTFVSRVFYHVSNLDALPQAMDQMSANRFKNRIYKNADIWDKLTDNQRKNFFNDLKSNPQNLNYLYEFFEKIRITMYELHARLLFRLLVELFQNKGLTYFESNLLASIDSFNDVDIKRIYEFLKEHENEKIGVVLEFNFNNYSYLNTYRKSLQLGIIDTVTPGMNFFNPNDKQRDKPQSRNCYLTQYSNEFLILLNDILEDEEIDISQNN